VFWATEKYGDNRLNAEATTSTSAHLGISLFFCTKKAHKKQDNNKNPTSELLRKTKDHLWMEGMDVQGEDKAESNSSKSEEQEQEQTSISV
jgi:hypothetical protein